LNKNFIVSLFYKMFTLNKDTTIHIVVEGIFCDFQEVNNAFF